MTGFRNEEQQVAWLRERLPRVGDDAAFVQFEHPVAITTDSQIEGVHFPPRLDPALVARRLLRINLSDLAASGAEPDSATCCVVAPAAFDLRRFFEQLIDECAAFGVELIGGDTTTADGGVLCTLTLFGRLPEESMLTRSVARAGDQVWVSGHLGRAALGLRLQQLGARIHDGRRATAGAEVPRVDLDSVSALRGCDRELIELARTCVLIHRLPEPRLALGRDLQELARQGRRVAALDLSDGLFKDAGRLARASSVAIEIERSALEPTGPFRALCAALGSSPWSLIAGGGEDYELLFTLAGEVEPPPACRRIGRVLAQGDDGRDLVRFDRPPTEFATGPGTSGWDHLRVDSED